MRSTVEKSTATALAMIGHGCRSVMVMIMPALRELELRHLIALDAVATEGTFGRAAIRLGYTQSAVSQQIAALERIVGGPLFDRPGGPRPVALTPLGKLMLTTPATSSSGWTRRETPSTASSPARPGASTSARSRACPTRCCRRSSAGCGRRTRTSTSGCSRTRRSCTAPGKVVSRRARRLVHHRPTGGRRPRVGGAARRPFVLVTRRGDLPEGPYRTAQLNGASLVGYPPSSCQQDIEDGLRAAGAVPTFVFRTLDNGAQLAMVRAGMGWAVMPLLCVDIRDPAIEIRPCARRSRPARSASCGVATGRSHRWPPADPHRR